MTVNKAKKTADLNIFPASGIVQVIICVVGLVANCLSIPVLKTKELYASTFNRLLIVLALTDNFYLTFALLESVRTDLDFCTDTHTIVFVHALYPLHNIILCLSIYLTVILSMERYRAVSKPIDYHAVIVSGRQWPIRVAKRRVRYLGGGEQ